RYGLPVQRGARPWKPVARGCRCARGFRLKAVLQARRRSADEPRASGRAVGKRERRRLTAEAPVIEIARPPGGRRRGCGWRGGRRSVAAERWRATTPTG